MAPNILSSLMALWSESIVDGNCCAFKVLVVPGVAGILAYMGGPC
jgi:hypothetical protein